VGVGCKTADITKDENLPKMTKMTEGIDLKNTQWKILKVKDTKSDEWHVYESTIVMRIAGQDGSDKLESAIKFERNTCKTTSFTNDKGQQCFQPFNCTKICCDGEISEKIIETSSQSHCFNIYKSNEDENVIVLEDINKGGFVMLMERMEFEKEGGRTHTIDDILGVWIPQSVTKGDESHTFTEEEAKKHPFNFTANRVEVRLDVNTCHSDCSYTERAIVCPDMGSMVCTRACCDKEPATWLAIFNGNVGYTFKKGTLEVTNLDKETTIILVPDGKR